MYACMAFLWFAFQLWVQPHSSQHSIYMYVLTTARRCCDDLSSWCPKTMAITCTHTTHIWSVGRETRCSNWVGLNCVGVITLCYFLSTITKNSVACDVTIGKFWSIPLHCNGLWAYYQHLKVGRGTWSLWVDRGKIYLYASQDWGLYHSSPLVLEHDSNKSSELVCYLTVSMCSCKTAKTLSTVVTFASGTISSTDLHFIVSTGLKVLIHII